MQEIGLVAVLDLKNFRRDSNTYNSLIGDMNTKTSKASGSMGKALLGVGAVAAKGALVGVTALGAGIGAVSTGGIRAAISFESAWTGVVKTTDGLVDSTGELTTAGAELQQGFRDLSKEAPIAIEELLAIGELGGQLGIQRDNLLDFTGTVAQLGVTTNLTTEDAAVGFAQLANIMGTSQQDFDRMGSSTVALGNNFATTEADVLAFAQRIAGAGEIAGLTEADVLGIGAAMSSVGVQAEAGGTATQKVLLGINEAVITSSDKLGVFAQTAGMSAQEFATLWENDASAAFTSFVEGLNTQGDNAIFTLEELDLTDQRLVRSFLSLANAGDLLGNTINTSNSAWKENTALATEAELRFGTTESKINVLKNTFNDTAVSLGTTLMPAFNILIDSLTSLANNPQFLAVFEQMGMWLAENLPSAIQTGASFFTNTLLPAISTFASFAQGTLIPAISTVISIFATNFGLALSVGAAIWNTVLLPAIQAAIPVFNAVSSFITNTLLPTILGFSATLQTIDWQSAWLLLQTAVQNATIFIQSIDWTTLGATVVSMLATGLAEAIPVVGQWVLQLGTFVFARMGEVDWLSIGMSVVDLIVAGFSAADEFISGAITQLVEIISTTLVGMDWATIGQNVLGLLMAGLAAASELISTAITLLFGMFSSTVISQDWASISTNVLALLADALSSGGQVVATSLVTLFRTAKDAILEIDWTALGNDILNFILTGLVATGALVIIGLTTLFNNAAAAIDDIDWYQVGFDIVTTIINGIKFIAFTLPLRMTVMGLKAVKALLEVDWWQAGVDALQKVIDGLKSLAGTVATELTTVATDGGAAFEGFDWAGLGTNLISSMSSAISNGASSVVDAVTGVAQGAIDAAKEALGISSPSKVFTAIGVNIAESFIDAVKSKTKDTDEAIKEMLGVGSSFSSFSGFFSKFLIDDNLDKRITNLTNRTNELKQAATSVLGADIGDLDRVEQARLRDLITSEFDENSTSEQMEVMLRRFLLNLNENSPFRSALADKLAIDESKLKGINQDGLRAILQSIDAQGDLNKLMAEQRAEQEKIAAIEKQRSDLAFLQQQLDLIKLVKDADLPFEADVFQGIQFGLDADPLAILNATSAAMGAIIQQSSVDLAAQVPNQSGVVPGINGNATGNATNNTSSRSVVLNFNPVINNGMDMNQFTNQVTQAVSGALATG